MHFKECLMLATLMPTGSILVELDLRAHLFAMSQAHRRCPLLFR